MFQRLVSSAFVILLAACAKPSGPPQVSTVIAAPAPSADSYFYYGDGGKSQAKLDVTLRAVGSLFLKLARLSTADPIVRAALDTCDGIPKTECAAFSALPSAKREDGMKLLIDLAARFPDADVKTGVVSQLDSVGPDGGLALLAGVRPGTSTLVFAVAALQKLDPATAADFSLLVRRMVHEIAHTVATASLGRVLTHGRNAAGAVIEDDSELIELVARLADKLRVITTVDAPKLALSADQNTFSAPVDQAGSLVREVGPLTLSARYDDGVTLAAIAGAGLRIVGSQVSGTRTDYLVYLKKIDDTAVTITATDRQTGLATVQRLAFAIARATPTLHPIWASFQAAGGVTMFLYTSQHVTPAGFYDAGSYGGLYDAHSRVCNIAIVIAFTGGNYRYTPAFTDDATPAGTIGWACADEQPGTHRFSEWYIPQSNGYRIIRDDDPHPSDAVRARDLYYWPG